MKKLYFITQFKIEFSLLFSGCRKVLGKIPEHMCISLDMPNMTWNIMTWYIMNDRYEHRNPTK